MTANALCSGTCNDQPGTIVQGKVRAAPLYFFQPATGDILECKATDAAVVRQEAEFLNHLLDQLWSQQSQIAALTQMLHQAQAQGNVTRQNAAMQKLNKAVIAEEKAREALFKEFKDLPKFNDGASGLLELLPLATHKGKAMAHTRRFTYVRSAKVKNHLRRYDNLPGDKTQLKSFYTKNENGEYELDRKKLKEAFSKVAAKGELSKEEVSYWADGWAPEFVEAFNAKYDAKAAKDKVEKDTPDEACLQMSGGAAFLRFFGGAGRTISSEVSTEKFKDLLKGRGEVNGKFVASARAGFDLASAQGDISLYLPYKKGLHLLIPAGKNAKGGKQELELGFFRMRLDLELSLACGASALAEGGLEFKLKADLTQGVKGAPAKKKPAAIANPKARVDRAVEAEAGAKAELSAFAGAEAGGKLSGSLEWQKAASTEFKAFAKVGAGLHGQAGIGGAAMFDISYTEGKFRIKVKLAGCVGLGLKGNVEAEVGIEHILEFDCWFKHQVTNALDQNLRYFSAEAWKAFVYMKALAIAEGHKLGDYLGRSVSQLEDKWELLLRTATRETLEAIRASKDYVLTSVAEAKALLLGLLERLKQDYQDLRRDVEDVARWLLSFAQTRQEADNICQRIGIDMNGQQELGSGSRRVAMLVGGHDRFDDLVASLKSDATPGHDLACTSDPAYRFAQGSGTHVAWRRSSFGQNNNQLV